MREHPLPPPQDEARRATPPDWNTELRTILFDGTGPAEQRLESLLDRLERRS